MNLSHRRAPDRRWAVWAGLGLLAVGVLILIVRNGLPNGISTIRHGSGPRTWHVRSAGRGRGAGTSTSPFRTIGDALEVARAGDTIAVGPGTYRGPVATSVAGRLGAPIVLSGQGARLVADGTGRLVTIRHSFVTIEGFDLSGADKGVWVEGAEGVRILGNRIHDLGGECVRLRAATVRAEVAGNTIGPCGLRNFSLAKGRKNGEGIYVGTAPEQLPHHGPERDVSRDNWIHDNDIVTRAECVDLKEGSTANLVERNRCSGGLDPDGSGFDSRGNSNTFRSNVATGEAGAGIRLGGDTPRDGLGNTVVDNTLVDNGGYGIKIERQPQGDIAANHLSGNRQGPVGPSDG